MAIDNLSKKLLEQVADLHKIPDGAVSIRKDGKSEVMRSTKHIEIFKKDDIQGIDVYVHSNCQNEACHIPVIVTENDLFDETYNDFYIEDGAVVTIVAGCGLHTDTTGGHSGIHTFHIGKNAKVSYVENHLATGKGTHKELSPTTNIVLGENSYMEILTTQLGGVDYANRITSVKLRDGANLVVKEKILTDRFDVAKTSFKATLSGKNCKCNIVSRSVAKGESEQEFKSNLVGKNACFGRVECDGILLDKAKITSTPKITAENNLAELSHEAAIGHIAGEQLIKLMSLGLTEKQAETKIIEGFLK